MIRQQSTQKWFNTLFNRGIPAGATSSDRPACFAHRSTRMTWSFLMFRFLKPWLTLLALAGKCSLLSFLHLIGLVAGLHSLLPSHSLDQSLLSLPKLPLCSDALLDSRKLLLPSLWSLWAPHSQIPSLVWLLQGSLSLPTLQLEMWRDLIQSMYSLDWACPGWSPQSTKKTGAQGSRPQLAT